MDNPRFRRGVSGILFRHDPHLFGTGASVPQEHPLFSVYHIVLEAQLAAIAAIRPGVRCLAVDAAARDVIDRAGYGEFFAHNTGHSIGIEVHEDPRFSPEDHTVLESGMLLTVEPAFIYRSRAGYG
ncbi:metalloprotease [Salmonella bongori]|nr:metalloprotease [Salmonella bongori]